MSEMKNCPFCGYGGSKFEMMTVGDHCEHWAMCTNCGATGPNELTKVRAAETWNMRREVYPSVQVDRGIDDPLVGIDTCKKPGHDAYEDLRSATPEQLLEAEEWFVRQGTDRAGDAIYFLRLGFQLARPGGWERVAPMWLRESRKRRDRCRT